MTQDEKAEFDEFVPKSEKFLEELSDDDKEWLLKSDQ